MYQPPGEALARVLERFRRSSGPNLHPHPLMKDHLWFSRPPAAAHHNHEMAVKHQLFENAFKETNLSSSLQSLSIQPACVCGLGEDRVPLRDSVGCCGTAGYHSPCYELFGPCMTQSEPGPPSWSKVVLVHGACWTPPGLPLVSGPVCGFHGQDLEV